MNRFAFICLVPLLCGCHLALHKGQKVPTSSVGKAKPSAGWGFEIGFGIKPPTNAVVGLSYTKIGIIVDQSPTTQTPTLTLGYQRGQYFRVPVGENLTVVPVQASVATKTALHTTIEETFSTGSATNR